MGIWVRGACVVCVLLWMGVSWVSGLGVPVLCVCVLLWMGVSWVRGACVVCLCSVMDGCV